MVICNIIHRESAFDTDVDKRLISKYKKCPAIDVVSDIPPTASLPSIIYGYGLAQAVTGKDVPRDTNKIKDNLYWTYSDSEIGFENWLDEFVRQIKEDWFRCLENGIDVVFNDFNVGEFAKALWPWPLIHEGTYEIYVAEVRGESEIVVHSIKKDTLEYIGIDPTGFLDDLHAKLGYRCLSIETPRHDLVRKPRPVFVDDILYSETGVWNGVDEILANFAGFRLERKDILVYYLRVSKHLRPRFAEYQ